MAEIGIGVRVFIGWTDRVTTGGGQMMRCRTGTIIDGPKGPGIVRVPSSGRKYWVTEKCWLVRADDGLTAGVVEHLLKPIGGGDTESEPERVAEPEEVA